MFLVCLSINYYTTIIKIIWATYRFWYNVISLVLQILGLTIIFLSLICFSVSTVSTLIMIRKMENRRQEHYEACALVQQASLVTRWIASTAHLSHGVSRTQATDITTGPACTDVLNGMVSSARLSPIPSPWASR